MKLMTRDIEKTARMTLMAALEANFKRMSPGSEADKRAVQYWIVCRSVDEKFISLL